MYSAMAGNIIPGSYQTKNLSFRSVYHSFIFLAIATTNAVIAGLIVFEAFKILEGKWEDCRHVIQKLIKNLIAILFDVFK